MATYQSKFPVTAKVVQTPAADNTYEQNTQYHKLLIEGARLSFANLWKLGKYSDAPKTGYDADVIIPLLPENKAAIETIMGAANAVMAPLSYDKIKGKQRKIKMVPLGKVMVDEDGDPITDAEGNEKVMYNDGHLIISTYNAKKSPPTYVTTTGVAVDNKASEGDDPYQPLVMPQDPCGQSAHELVGTGNNVRLTLAFTKGEDTYNGGKPKMWVKLIAVQFLAEDEKLAGTGDGAALGIADGEFGAVAAPAPSGFTSEDFDTEIPPGNPAAEAPAAEEADTGLSWLNGM